MSTKLKKSELEQKTHEVVTEHLRPYGGVAGGQTVHFKAYIDYKPTIMAFLPQLLEEGETLKSLSVLCEEMKEAQLIQDGYLDNIILSFVVFQSVEDEALRHKLSSLIDAHIKPRTSEKEPELLVKSYFFARLLQHGASYNKASEVISSVGRKTKPSSNGNRATEDRAGRMKKFLENNEVGFLSGLMDMIVIAFLLHNVFSMQAYCAKHYKKKKADAQAALEKNFMMPLYSYLASFNGCEEWPVDLSFEEKSAQIDEKLQHAAIVAVQGLSEHMQGSV